MSESMQRSGLFTNGGGAVPLEGVEVRAEVLAAHARVLVRQRYRNAEPLPIEAIYTFPLPADATLSGFAMTCAGRRIEGEVQERKQAFRTYDDALVSGHGAALLEQERPNVFTASVGNLLPGEETLVEIEYLQRLAADEGALRWMLPTLVAPRYIPGNPQGNRTGHGAAEPTGQVPDADRITPRIGEVSYGLKLELTFDLGRPVALESPSHALAITTDGTRTIASFASGVVALDRDVVITARGLGDEPLAGLSAHRTDGPGTFALTVVPDLFGHGQAAAQEVVFVLDRSGSMGGSSMTEAQAALRLCLRHLREGDRFNVLAFDDSVEAFAPAAVPYTQQTLARADAWVRQVDARGGTELLQPLVQAVRAVPNGVVVLLTDGQVGNEAAILEAVLKDRGNARIYAFGIGTNVSDALLRDLAKRTGGAVEFIHPGERIDDKVVAVFARATAARVGDVQITFDGVAPDELAPAPVPALVDGEPWTLFGRYTTPGTGTARIRGRFGAEPFALEVPIVLPVESNRPGLPKLWASERIRDLEAMDVEGRRADRMRERILELAIAHGVSSKHTAFVVVEKREGARLASGVPETRFVPVNAPAGWDLFQAKAPRPPRGVPHYAAAMAPPSMPARPSRPSRFVASLGGFDGDETTGAVAPSPASPRAKKGGPLDAVARLAGRAFSRKSVQVPSAEESVTMPDLPSPAASRAGASGRSTGLGSVTDLLAAQEASGLWPPVAGADSEPSRRIRATAAALLQLLREGITSAHPVHGAQVKKAVVALLAQAEALRSSAPSAAELALGIAWLVSTGARTRREIEQVVAGRSGLAGLQAMLPDESAVRVHLERTVAA